MSTECLVNRPNQLFEQKSRLGSTKPWSSLDGKGAQSCIRMVWNLPPANQTSWSAPTKMRKLPRRLLVPWWQDHLQLQSSPVPWSVYQWQVLWPLCSSAHYGAETIIQREPVHQIVSLSAPTSALPRYTHPALPPHLHYSTREDSRQEERGRCINLRPQLSLMGTEHVGTV